MFHAAGAQLDDPGATGLDDVAGLPTGYLTPRAVIAGSSAIPSLIAHWRTSSFWQPREFFLATPRTAVRAILAAILLR
jgi:hypothetical protein